MAKKAPTPTGVLPVIETDWLQRLGLIGKQVLQYRHMYPLAPDVEQIATDLCTRFMPEVVAGRVESLSLVGGVSEGR